jgi:hypothetical protein
MIGVPKLLRTCQERSLIVGRSRKLYLFYFDFEPCVSSASDASNRGLEFGRMRVVIERESAGLRESRNGKVFVEVRKNYCQTFSHQPS